MTVNGPEIPDWLRKLILAIPEPGPKALSTVYGLLIFSFLVQVLVSIMMALGGR